MFGNSLLTVLDDKRGNFVRKQTKRGREESEEDKKAQAKTKKRRALEKKFRNRAYICPDAATDATKERTLLRLATQGVVTLFNAIGKHQKILGKETEKAGASKRKQREAFQEARAEFLTMLESGKAPKKSKTNESDDEKELEGGSQKDPQWSVLDANPEGAILDTWDQGSSSEESAKEI